jgi:hypothetical protein
MRLDPFHTTTVAAAVGSNTVPVGHPVPEQAYPLRKAVLSDTSSRPYRPRRFDGLAFEIESC